MHPRVSRTDPARDPALATLALSPGAVAEASELALIQRGSVPEPAPSVSDAVNDLAGHSPDRVAFVGSGGRTTYGQLRDRVARLRALLLDRGCEPGDRVAVSGPRSLDNPVAFLALESLGATYVPVDHRWPVERLSRIFAQNECAYVLVHEVRHEEEAEGEYRALASTLLKAAAETDVELLRMSEAAGHGPSPLPWSPRRCADRQARYVIHTSGSSGTPKGAVVEHRGMANHLRHMVDALGLTSADVVAFSAPPTYVVSIWQMLAALTVGATVAVIDDFDTAHPRRLLKALAEHRVSIAQLVPTVLTLVVDDLRRRACDDPLPELRWLIATGEELRPQLAARVLDALPNTHLMNAYGMSECSDDVAQHVVRREDTQRPRLPVGRPIANTALHVLVEQDENWRPARPGETGELFVGGLPVGGGYVGAETGRTPVFFHDEVDPASPTQRLYRTGDLACVEDGLAFCLGRADRQVKVRGMRIDLGEIEATLRQHPCLVHCAVTAEAAQETQRLLIHYVAAEDVHPKTLQEFLDGRYVTGLPAHWVRLREMPLMRNGKIDYRALAGR
ncbi:amino acid adenylation domain-containing protein [Streptomyces sp. S.PNR 29]|uniref:amino acid adenylation domain-containing protein n=1 Tax=Streptomyces sp. S.PNR 29 TaxID=2973805 RepID=UPI0025AF1933|nr:amino acid adenylation domain-containing protein [Streptomyces sp. S.PNR 29]MDN0197617.1 amino acid adenylation domain-containing protein [Streptomyces sp. S.PNR 29]